MILTHVDDFAFAGSDDFIEEVITKVQNELTVSKIEKNVFRFTGVDISKQKDYIKMSMNESANSVEDLEDVRNVKSEEKLSAQEMKVYRKYTGKVSWLAANTRPDLSVIALEMSKKMNSATIKDLRRIKHVVEKIKSQPSEVLFSRIEKNNESLKIFGIGDASYKADGKSTGGTIVLIGTSSGENVVPIF